MRKPREAVELMDDRNFIFRFGQLVGAVEMASHQLQQSKDEEAQKVGQRLSVVSSWFFEEKGGE